MSANQRGLLIFAIMIVLAWFLCGFIPNTFLPSQGWAFALPVIQVPGEVYYEGWPAEGFVWTNTLTGTLGGDLLALLFAFAVFRASKGWRKEIPGRLQGLAELLVEFFYNQSKNMAGTSDIVKKQLFPLVASIFLFLLMSNWLELVPGVDSIGIMHCAKPGQAGYARVDWRLHSTQPLNGGVPITDKIQYETCEIYLEGHTAGGEGYSEEELEERIHELEEEYAALEDSHGDEAHHLELELAGYEMRLEALHELEAFGEPDEAAFAAVEEKVEAGEELTEEEQHTLELAEEWQLIKTRQEYPGAVIALSDEELAEGKIQPYGFVVTPYIRAAATDMNLVFALAIISVAAMQYFGMAALGPGYWQKFVNINALGNAGKRPMGLMDFGVGLFEIISEISKIISLAFRLFGNIFAGQLLLFIIGFLIATGMPVLVYGLEFLVGMIQAYVFAVLTLVFSGQAMVSHHHDDDHDDHH